MAKAKLSGTGLYRVSLAQHDLEQLNMSWSDKLKAQHAVIDFPSTWKGNKSLEGIDLHSANERYNAWVNSFKESHGLPVEYLLPRVNIVYVDKFTTPMLMSEERYALNPHEGEELSRMQWGYYYPLGGGLSTADRTPALRRRIQSLTQLRMQMINDVVEGFIGDDIGHSTMIDFACNWGGFAIDMALRGMKHVTAFDFKNENVAKARRLAKYMGADNVEVERQNVYDLPPKYSSGFDVVYNLGLLYHVTDPVRLATITYNLTRKVAVFDTVTHREPVSAFIMGHHSQKEFARPGMGEYSCEMHPTYRALIDLILLSGFRVLVEVVPVIGDTFVEKEKDVYFQSLRRTIIAFK
jgi:hypothetical protein